MTALSMGRRITQKGDLPALSYQDLPQKANTVFYPGAICVLSGGYLAPASEASGLVAVGIYDGPNVSDSTGLADGAIRARVRSGVFGLVSAGAGDAITQADVGKLCYLVDDQTVAKTSNGGLRSVAGQIKEIDPQYPTRIFVQVGVAGQGAEAPAPKMQVGTLTLVAGTKTLAAGITITADSKVFVSLNTPGGATQGVKYKVPDAGLVVGGPGTGAFAVTAVDNAGATVATDTSTLNYLIVG